MVKEKIILNLIIEQTDALLGNEKRYRFQCESTE